jgi:hypothetical protein
MMSMLEWFEPFIQTFNGLALGATVFESLLADTKALLDTLTAEQRATFLESSISLIEELQCNWVPPTDALLTPEQYRACHTFGNQLFQALLTTFRSFNTALQ